jgi:malic enzyme-like protein
VLLGLSGPGAVSATAVRGMAAGAIVFAMANPVPEVQPEEVRDGVAIMVPGRSDYPNQINNVLAFPGVFKGALEVRSRTINEEMKHAIARVIPDDELHADHIIPSIFNRRVAESVAEAVANAAGSVALSTAHARRHRAERWRGSSNRPAGSARSAWTACPSASSAGSPTHAPAERASRPPRCGPMRKVTKTRPGRPLPRQLAATKSTSGPRLSQGRRRRVRRGCRSRFGTLSAAISGRRGQ